MRFLVAILAICFSVGFAQSKEANPLGISFYGSFLHTERVPNALFFFSDIKEDDSFELRKALRSHNIDTIVLSSRGGSVLEGLSMAGIIHDKGLKTYVPEQGLGDYGNCASACSFMFFGGSARVADGALGVHQFYSGAAQQKAQIGVTESVAQFTVSEIIGFLNEFDTPPFVFERMFQQKEMYYFTAREVAELNRKPDDITEADKTAIARFIRMFNLELERLKEEDRASERVADAPKPKPKPKPKTVTPKVSNTTVIAKIQRELNRLNCSAGTPDGVIGKKTRAALKRFANATQRELPEYLLSSQQFLAFITASQVKCVSSTNVANRILEGRWIEKSVCSSHGGTPNYRETRRFNLTAKHQSGSTVIYEGLLGQTYKHSTDNDTIIVPPQTSGLTSTLNLPYGAATYRATKPGKKYIGKREDRDFWGTPVTCTFWITKTD